MELRGTSIRKDSIKFQRFQKIPKDSNRVHESKRTQKNHRNSKSVPLDGYKKLRSCPVADPPSPLEESKN